MTQVSHDRLAGPAAADRGSALASFKKRFGALEFGAVAVALIVDVALLSSAAAAYRHGGISKAVLLAGAAILVLAIVIRWWRREVAVTVVVWTTGIERRSGPQSSFVAWGEIEQVVESHDPGMLVRVSFTPSFYLPRDYTVVVYSQAARAIVVNRTYRGVERFAELIRPFVAGRATASIR